MNLDQLYQQKHDNACLGNDATRPGCDNGAHPGFSSSEEKFSLGRQVERAAVCVVAFANFGKTISS
jgi:hypothetical protein